MIPLDKALTIALPLVSGKVKHQHYDHVVKLTEETYRPMITGEKAEHLLVRFNLRESVEAHQQRLRLTVLTSPSTANTLMAPVRKLPRVKPVVNTATFGPNEKEKDKQLAEATANFYGGKSVDHYFGSILLDQAAIDPNAFCLTLFDEFDPRFQKPMPYPSIVPCTDAWNYSYFNGILQWLLVHRAIKYTEKQDEAKKKKVPAGKEENPPLEKDGHAFWLYTDQNHIMFTQIDPALVRGSAENVVIKGNGQVVDNVASLTIGTRDKYFYRVSKTELYEVSFWQHKAGEVQAFRLGCNYDQRTRGETMVNLWHAAVPYITKGIKSGSELDLSAALHAFLQKLSYETPCGGYTNEQGAKIECVDGHFSNGDQCPTCKGTGWQVHTSGQDHISIRMPRTKEQFLELANMVHYVPLPIEILDWQRKYVEDLERFAFQAVYNANRFRNTDVTNTTATGDIIDLQSLYDTLRPMADWYSESRVKVYRLIGSFVVGSDAVKSLQVQHEFPRNMRFETLSERVLLLKSLREAGASNSSIAQVNDDLLEDLYIDDPVALKQAQVKASFDPFLGKSEATIMSLISQDLCTREEKVLWTNWNLVFAEAETRTKATTADDGSVVDFWQMDRAKQQGIIDKIVDEIIDGIEEQQDAAAERMGLGMTDDADPEDGGGNPEAEDDPTGKGLPNSPGQRATGQQDTGQAA